MNQPNKNISESTKLPWSSPELSELKPDLIRQQDEEILYHVLNSEEVFRLVNGTASDYRLKEDSQDFDALSVVNAMSAYDFAWKSRSRMPQCSMPTFNRSNQSTF